MCRATKILSVGAARFRGLSNFDPLGIVSTDRDGACTYANDRWQAIFGISQIESLGCGWTGVLHPEDKGAVFAEWQRMAKP